MRLAVLACLVVFLSVVLVPVGGLAGPPAARHAAAGSPQLIAPLVRYAFALEKDADYHRTTSQAEAKQELLAAAAVLRQALALGPTGSAATDLRQALAKDEDAAGLVSTVNQGKVHVDIAGALNRKEAALKALGQPLTGPIVPPQVAKPPPPPPVRRS